MGYIRHHSIIVTAGNPKDINRAHKAANTILNTVFAEHPFGPGEGMLSPILTSLVNGYRSFFIAPDGSKEGWSTSELGDKARELIIKKLKKIGVDYIEVYYGDDDNQAEI